MFSSETFAQKPSGTFFRIVAVPNIKLFLIIIYVNTSNLFNLAFKFVNRRLRLDVLI